jgi:hypothetical protein
MMIVETNKQKQYLIELARITLLNCLNANGIIRFKYNQKLKQKQRGKQCQKNMLQLKN